MPKRCALVAIVLSVLASSSQAAETAGKPLETIVLKNDRGLRWELPRYAHGWTLGTVSLNHESVAAPITAGMIGLGDLKTHKQAWLAAATGQRVDDRTARFTGSRPIEGVTFRFDVEVALKPAISAAAVTTRWTVDKDLDGYEVCLAYHDVGQGDWRCTFYPFAGNSTQLHRDRLGYVGVPAALMFRPDLSLAVLFGIDPALDYFNPHTWTGAIGFHFNNGETAPQYRVGGGKLSAGTRYCVPLQIILSDAGNSAAAISELVPTWIKLNSYKVQPLSVRTPAEAFAIFVEGRRKSSTWRPGLGYQIMDNWKVIYTAESPANACFDYLLYEHTGDAAWRQRAFETMDFVLKAQHTDPSDPHYGAIETNYELDGSPKVWTIPQPPFTGEKVDPELKSGRFCSRDHSPNFGFKLDMHGYAARYMLMLWERVKQKEGLDRKEWREAAVRMAEWIARQRNPDGGLPQVVDYRPGAKRSMSVICGRTLVAMPVIARITGEKKFTKLADDLERFLRRSVEGRFWFTGAHVDLWPKDYEADSVWQAVEYWVDKYDRTKEPECLRRAEADAWLAFLTWCPKQLSWVENPTQTCHTEQEHFLQYSNYNYNNRKYYCLDRLARLTGEPLFRQLCERLVQMGIWAQATTGKWMGGQYERVCDPWGAVGGPQGTNSKGQIYLSELALEANLQLLEMGLVRPNP